MRINRSYSPWNDGMNLHGEPTDVPDRTARNLRASEKIFIRLNDGQVLHYGRRNLSTPW